MKNGKEVRPNGQIIIKKISRYGRVSYFIEGDHNNPPTDYLRNARKHADSLPKKEPEL